MDARTIAAIALALAAGPWLGCAGSTASRAMYDDSQRLTISDMRTAAQRLATNTAGEDAFAKFRAQKGIGESKDVVVLLRKIENRTGAAGERDNDVSYQEQLFDALEQAFATNGIRMRFDRIVLGSSASDDARAVREDERTRVKNQVKGQDSDDDIDQSTGDMALGKTAKATLFMDLVVFAQQEQGKRNWELRAKYYEVTNQLYLIGADSLPKVPAR